MAGMTKPVSKAVKAIIAKMYAEMGNGAAHRAIQMASDGYSNLARDAAGMAEEYYTAAGAQAVNWYGRIR